LSVRPNSGAYRPLPGSTAQARTKFDVFITPQQPRSDALAAGHFGLAPASRLR